MAVCYYEMLMYEDAIQFCDQALSIEDKNIEI